MASKKHIKQGGKLSGERRTDELCGICELCAHIRMENGETVSIETTEQIKGYVTTSEFVKMLRNRTLTSYEGDGIERPIVTTRDEVYPKKERARKSEREKKKHELEATAAASKPPMRNPSMDS